MQPHENHASVQINSSVNAPPLPTGKRSFCNSDEFLLFVVQLDCKFAHEAELHPMSLDEAVEECDDATMQIIRMDHSNWRGEDITEDVAAAWLSHFEPDAQPATALPYFVQNSEAWLNYLEEFAIDSDQNNVTMFDDFDYGTGRYAS